VKCAMAQDELGWHTEALATLKEALELNPASTAGWNNLGIVCQHIGKLEEARTAFERAYKLNPAQADPLVNLGAVCLRQGDPGNALQYLQLASELLPGHPAVHANLALTYAVFGRLEEAEDSLRLAVLYGFDQATGIEEKITALKKVRDKIISDAQAPETGPGASPGSPDIAGSPDTAGSPDMG
jgi:Flp pilus assembly protein TadD